MSSKRAEIVPKFDRFRESAEGGNEAPRLIRDESAFCDSHETTNCSASAKFAIIFILARGLEGRVSKRGERSLRDTPSRQGTGGFCVSTRSDCSCGMRCSRLAHASIGEANSGLDRAIRLPI